MSQYTVFYSSRESAFSQPRTLEAVSHIHAGALKCAWSEYGDDCCILIVGPDNSRAGSITGRVFAIHPAKCGTSGRYNFIGPRGGLYSLDEATK